MDAMCRLVGDASRVIKSSIVREYVSRVKNLALAGPRKLRAMYRAYAMLSLFEERSAVSSSEARGFNACARDKWVADRARSVEPGSRVLDVGAGTAPYRSLFKHCRYETQDFAQ